MKHFIKVLIGFIGVTSIVVGTPALANAQDTRAVINFDKGWISINNGGSGAKKVSSLGETKVTFSAYYEYYDQVPIFTASLQESTNKKNWVDTGLKASTTDELSGTFMFIVPPKKDLKKNKSFYYRAVVATDQTTIGDESPAVKLKYENPKLYTGFKKTIRNDLVKYCPTVLIDIKKLKKSQAGEYRTSTETVYIDPKIKKYQKYKRASVAMHECAHHLQWETYGRNYEGWKQMEAEADKIFHMRGVPGVEHMADCVAHVIYPKGYLGYGGSCSKKQIRYSKKFLRGETLLA